MKMTPNSSLLQWLATFEIDGKASVELKDDAYYNLADGYVCAKILNQISPQYFTDKWLDGIRGVAPNGSWRLRVSNLKRILQKIYDYASDLQSNQFRPNAIQPDVAVIAQNFDPDQISRLIQLILFCAINSDKKQDYIEKIRDLPIQVKQDIKEAIEELLINNNDAYNQKLNSSHVGNDSVNSDLDADNSNISNQRFSNNSSSYNAVLSPARSSTYRATPRRDSSQNLPDTPRRSDSHLDASSKSILDNPNVAIEEVKQRLNDALTIKDEKAQACHELELKLKQLQLERDQLAYENQNLLNEKKISSSPIKTSDFRRQSNRFSDITIDSRNLEDRLNSEDEDSSNLILQQSKKLQFEVQKLKEEIIKIETEKEDHRLKANLLKEDLDKITSKHDELRNKAEHVKRLQDQLDEQRQISEKVINYETMIENLVKKNNDIKKELKSIEEKNASHIHKIVKLEEENSQLTSTLSRSEIYKKQLQEAQVKLSQETHRADKAEIELARLSEKYSATKKENEKLFETTNQLMRGNSAHFSSSAAQDSSNKMSQIKTLLEEDTRALQGGAPDSMSTSLVELKEKLLRLECENELLQTKLNSKRENDNSVLGGLLESANARCTKLEIENRQSRKKVIFLEGRLKDLSNPQNGPSTSSGVINDSSSDNTLALMNRVEELQRLLFQREQELMDSETKYKKNIQKAKEVIKTMNNSQSVNNSILHPSCMSSTSSFNSSSLDETNLLKQQLKDREDRLIELERSFNEYKKIKEIHERLMISAFYGLVSISSYFTASSTFQKCEIKSHK